MKVQTKICTALLGVLLLFSMFSGCRLKKKLVDTSSSKESSKSITSEKVVLNKVDSSAFNKIDSSKIKTNEQSKSTTKRTYELTIELDRNKQLTATDSNGNLSMTQLVNSALRNATSLKLKAEEQLSNESAKNESKNFHTSESGTDVKKDNSTVDKKANQSGSKKSSGRKVNAEIDSTAKTNLGPIWLYVLIIAIVGAVVFIVYKKMK